jgi:hypothetical protein
VSLYPGDKVSRWDGLSAPNETAGTPERMRTESGKVGFLVRCETVGGEIADSSSRHLAFVNTATRDGEGAHWCVCSECVLYMWGSRECWEDDPV